VVVACLFAAGHIPVMISTGFTWIEAAGLLRDAALGVAVILVLQAIPRCCLVLVDPLLPRHDAIWSAAADNQAKPTYHAMPFRQARGRFGKAVYWLRVSNPYKERWFKTAVYLGRRYQTAAPWKCLSYARISDCSVSWDSIRSHHASLRRL
jgi:hypothetical protein